MGVEYVQCPSCESEIRVGVPRESEVLEVSQDGKPTTTVDSKTRLLTCPDGHDVWVRFSI
ncbi:hypothetical protein HTSR_1946 [Halodesulfurarchaeum formicicum]|uniref:Uncharacterized protein n=1 Tax=Halodesulfurarchaeum formicicum TaxID=1873524 RepID=A0A1D8S6Z7_9EURY|nr:hypothetical protein [Halodesulfurarchaeum formicicum]AOW81108.1 hypothetical protein HTSR_1946 [Halodesulfurarchaeum formicicum]APE96450.1 hypothetical protein HSR6_2021 [Halodesulfurarchaeum formicicum]